MTEPRLLHAVDGPDVVGAVAAALSGGPPVAPLPADGTERRLALEVVAPGQPVVEPDAAAVVVTSGSTGRPRGVVLTRAALLASAAATHARLGGPGDWLLALPTHYVAGLMVCVRAVAAGTRVLPVAPDLSGLPGPAPTGRPRYLSVVPTQLARALDRPDVLRGLAGLDAVLVGGAAVDPRLLDRARAAGVRVVTTYGMTETCGGCVYDGVPLDGVEVAVGDDGRVRIGGPVLFSGYRLRPDLTAEALVAGTLLTRDRGAWSGGRLTVLGRVDDVVATGGRKVDLAEVERLARQWRDDVAVIALPDPEWGATVVAVTAGTEGHLDDAADEDALRHHLSRHLPAYALPRRLVRLAALPRTAGGKVDRQRLVADLGAGVGGPAR